MIRNLAFLSVIAQSCAVQVVRQICRVLILVSVTGFAGCRTLSFKKDSELTVEETAAAAAAAEAQKPAPVTLPVGVIHHVDEAAGFVLIRSSRSLQLEPGTILTVHGGQGVESATVKVSPARKGSFLTADIVGGVPKRGEQTTMQYSSQSIEAPPMGAPESNEIQVLE